MYQLPSLVGQLPAVPCAWFLRARALSLCGCMPSSAPSLFDQRLSDARVQTPSWLLLRVILNRHTAYSYPYVSMQWLQMVADGAVKNRAEVKYT